MSSLSRGSYSKQRLTKGKITQKVGEKRHAGRRSSSIHNISKSPSRDSRPRKLVSSKKGASRKVPAAVVRQGQFLFPALAEGSSAQGGPTVPRTTYASTNPQQIKSINNMTQHE